MQPNNISITVCETAGASDVMDSADLLTSRTSDAGSDGHWELGDSPQISATAVGDGETIPGQIPLNSSGADLRRLQVKQNYSPVSVYQ